MAKILRSKSCRLACMLSLTASFCLLELISGYFTNSMALVADAFHMLSDVLALLIAFFSVRIAKRKTIKNTFGWARAEVLGAMINSIFLCALCCSILVEAVKRLLDVEDINDPKQILIVGTCGLIVNIIGMMLFHGTASSDHHYHPPARIGEEKNLEQLKADGGLQRETEGIEQLVPPSTVVDDDEDEDDDGEENRPYHRRHRRKRSSHADRPIPNANSQAATVADEFCASANGVAPEATFPADFHARNTTADGEDPSADDHIAAAGASSAGQLNMRAAFLHVMGDALGSVVVIISALILWLTEWRYRFYIDPVMSGILVFIIICTTIPVLKESTLILLQTAPPKNRIDVDELKRRLASEFAPHIFAVHELHVWQLAGDKIIASAHLQCRSLADYMRVARKLKRFFHLQGIHSTTLQPEIVSADGDEGRASSVISGSDGEGDVSSRCGDADTNEWEAVD